MPVSKERAALYPGGSLQSQLWKDIRAWVRLRSGGRCEGSPAFPDCRAENGKPHPVTGSRVVLTVAHINHDPRFNGPDDLRHWCQRCHITHDAPMKAAKRRLNADEQRILKDRTTEQLRAELEAKREGAR